MIRRPPATSRPPLWGPAADRCRSRSAPPRDSRPSAWPSCDPNAMPPICDIIDSSGPAMLLASSGSEEAHTVEICSAIGSHSRFQVSSVLSTQSVGVQPSRLGGARGQRRHPVQPGLGQVHGVGDRRIRRVRDGRDETRSSSTRLGGPGRSSPGRTDLPPVITVPALLNIWPKPGEDLPEFGHVEFPAAHAERARTGRATRARIGILLPALLVFGVVPAREAERQVSHDVNGTHRRNDARIPGHAVAELWASPARGPSTVGRREQADSDLDGRAGADRGVRRCCCRW